MVNPNGEAWHNDFDLGDYRLVKPRGWLSKTIPPEPLANRPTRPDASASATAVTAAVLAMTAVIAQLESYPGPLDPAVHAVTTVNAVTTDTLVANA